MKLGFEQVFLLASNRPHDESSGTTLDARAIPEQEVTEDRSAPEDRPIAGGAPGDVAVHDNNR